MSGIILYDDVNLRPVSREVKMFDIRQYMEDLPDFEVIKPTLEICEYFGDQIGYAMASSMLIAILVPQADGNYRLETRRITPNIYHYMTKGSIINHLSDPSKLYYLHKVTVQRGVWSLFVYEKSNIAALRNKKLAEILG